MRAKKNDNFFIGLMIGATVPVIGYWGIEILFEVLTDAGIMDSVTGSTIGKRSKTLALLAICCNIIPSQFSNNMRYTNILRGVVFATFIYAALWGAHFYLGFSL